MIKNTNQVTKYVHGAPVQFGHFVKIIKAIDQNIMDVSEHIGKIGRVQYLDYNEYGCGQKYPYDPMIGVLLLDGIKEEFWPEEIVRI